jgi:signal transduction histidine kinase
MKKKRIYSAWAKMLVILILIVAAITAGISGSGMFMGLAACDMTLNEVISPVTFEESEAAISYLSREESNLMELLLSEDQGTDISNDDLEESNALIYVKNLDTGQVYTNVEGWRDSSLSGVLKAYQTSAFSDLSRPQLYDSYDYENMMSGDLYQGISGRNEIQLRGLTQNMIEDFQRELDTTNIQLFIGLNTNYPLQASDSYGYAQWYDCYLEYNNRVPFGCFVLFCISIAVGVIMLILAGVQAGHRQTDKVVHLAAIDRFPIEILMLIDIGLWVFLLWIMVGWSNSLWRLRYMAQYANVGSVSRFWVSTCGVVQNTLLCICAALLVAWEIKHYSRRIKAKKLGGSLIVMFSKQIKMSCFKIKKGIGVIYRSRKEYQKLMILYVAFAAFQVLMMVVVMNMSYNWWGILAFLMFLILVVVDMGFLVFLLRNVQGRDEIKKGMEEIAKGNLDYQIDIEQMSGDNRQMAEEMNRVRDGLKQAVEAEMKSERLKTDLITNVSHDIKTPLTSIINYVDILKRENIQDEKIAGYIDILDRKSMRLKQLTEDLVEASKISSGNITLDMQEINLKQLIKQTNGEFEEKFSTKNLELVCSLPESEMIIKADGRRMFRVIENLYNNTAKYSMPHSRVYVTGELKGGKVIFSIKNMSEYALNFKAEELLERFVRGDVSRSTEGSGLGLEIARNLTVMQGGTFDLYVDGDLFKVTIAFDAI